MDQLPQDGALQTADQPDWSRIDKQIHCLMCGYNLRGLTEPRCPECGCTFTWPEMLDPSLRVHPYLFEHHPERNVRSFCQTAIGGWRPHRFWTRLDVLQPSRPRRLVLYWFIAACAYALALTAFFVTSTIKETNIRIKRTVTYVRTSPDSYRPEHTIHKHPTTQAFIDYLISPRFFWKRPLAHSPGDSQAPASACIYSCTRFPGLGLGDLCDPYAVFRFDEASAPQTRSRPAMHGVRL